MTKSEKSCDVKPFHEHTEFDSFLKNEKSETNVCFNKVYLRMTGELVSAIMLSQIAFWHKPNRNGKPKLKIKKDGKLWMAKKNTDWQEHGISKRRAERVLKDLKELGLIETEIFKFYGRTSVHIRLIPDKFYDEYERASFPQKSENRTSEQRSEIRKQDIPGKSENRTSRNPKTGHPLTEDTYRDYEDTSCKAASPPTSSFDPLEKLGDEDFIDGEIDMNNELPDHEIIDRFNDENTNGRFTNSDGESSPINDKNKSNEIANPYGSNDPANEGMNEMNESFNLVDETINGKNKSNGKKDTRQKKNKNKSTPQDKRRAKRLYEGCLKKDFEKLTGGEKVKWFACFKNLKKKEGVTIWEIDDVLDWIIANHGNKFVPSIRHFDHFRQKFEQIQDCMERQAEDRRANPEKYIELPEFEARCVIPVDFDQI